MTKSITVGNKDFKSKKEAKEYFDGIVKSYQVGDTINNPIHHELLLTLLKMKSNAKEKIDCGVERFYKNTNIGGTQSVWFERSDGSNDDFSPSKTINDIKSI